METEKVLNINIKGFYRLLTIIFVIAKIFGKIDWTWGLVFTPFFIEIGLTFLQVFFKTLLENLKKKAEEMKKQESILEKAIREAKEGKS